MKRVLLDADAFLCIKKLGLLQLLQEHANPSLRLVITGYIALHELSTVRSHVEQLQQQELLQIEQVPARSVIHLKRRCRGNRRLPRLDKGELEAIAWVQRLPEDERPCFITNDRGAQAGAAHHKVPWGDVMDFVIAMLEAEVATKSEMQAALHVWNNPVQQICRPKDWAGFDRTYAQRRSRGERAPNIDPAASDG